MKGVITYFGLLLLSVVGKEHILEDDSSSKKTFVPRARTHEYRRRRIFAERHDSWPDPRWLEREVPSFTAAMARKQAYVMEIKEPAKRWAAFIDLAQARLLDSLTKEQWQVVSIPNGIDIYERLLSDFKKRRRGDGALFLPNREAIIKEEQVPKSSTQQYKLGKTMGNKLLNAFRPLHEQWLNTSLESIQVNGIRIFTRGETVDEYIEPPDTHVITGILQLDAQLEAPFPVEILDKTGKYTVINLKQGELFMYESAKCFIARRKPLDGNFSAVIFLHYRPIGWKITQSDIAYAVPPFWARGLSLDSAEAFTISPEEKSQQAKFGEQFIFEDNDPFFVRPGEEHSLLDSYTTQTIAETEPAVITFILKAASGADPNPAQGWADHTRCAIIISWISIDTKIFVPFGRLTPMQPLLRVNTHLGHLWRASRESDASEVSRWKISATDTTFEVRFPIGDSLCFGDENNVLQFTDNELQQQQFLDVIHLDSSNTAQCLPDYPHLAKSATTLSSPKSLNADASR